MMKGLEHMIYEKRLRGMALVSLEKTKCLMVGSKEDRARLFSVVPMDMPKRQWAQIDIWEILIEHKQKLFYCSNTAAGCLGKL